MAAESAIVARLLATTGVTTLVGDRIDPLLVAERTTYPCVTYRQVDRDPVSAFGDDVALTQSVVEVESFAETFTAARALAAAVQTSLQRWRGTAGGVTVQSVFFEQEVPDYDPETRVHSIRQDFRVWSEER